MDRQVVIRVLAASALLAAAAACRRAEIFDPRITDDSPLPNALADTFTRDTARLPHDSLPRGSGRILIDASRDGGGWWFPQWAQEGGYDPALWHQGYDLAQALRSAGWQVRELPRPFTITPALLDSFQLVIRAGVFGSYAPDEVLAYREWVRRGGRLLLLADHMRWVSGPADAVGNAFGLPFQGITYGNTLVPVSTDSIVAGVAPLYYGVGSALLEYPDSAVILGTLGPRDYVDLNNDQLQEPDEPSAPVVFGRMRYGSGRIVFCGDLNMWEWLPQPLLTNVLRYLTGA